jgi:GH15 family glucan-1,4-alpha-glucosidase
MTLLIEDYALVGNNATAALVGNNGSIDWLCFPRFDSAACFAALLGIKENGHWRIAPKVAHPKTRDVIAKSGGFEVIEKMERETRIELATNSLEGCDSTIELLPRPRELSS